jgi:hypothetical protein
MLFSVSDDATDLGGDFLWSQMDELNHNEYDNSDIDEAIPAVQKCRLLSPAMKGRSWAIYLFSKIPSRR